MTAHAPPLPAPTPAEAAAYLRGRLLWSGEHPLTLCRHVRPLGTDREMLAIVLAELERRGGGA